MIFALIFKILALIASPTESWDSLASFGGLASKNSSLFFDATWTFLSQTDFSQLSLKISFVKKKNKSSQTETLNLNHDITVSLQIAG